MRRLQEVFSASCVRIVDVEYGHPHGMRRTLSCGDRMSSRKPQRDKVTEQRGGDRLKWGHCQ